MTASARGAIAPTLGEPKGAASATPVMVEAATAGATSPIRRRSLRSSGSGVSVLVMTERYDEPLTAMSVPRRSACPSRRLQGQFSQSPCHHLEAPSRGNRGAAYSGLVPEQLLPFLAVVAV